jgi:hypothetical protein
VTDKPKESLDQLRARVKSLERPNLTSPLYSKIGWPFLILGILLWIVIPFTPGGNLLMALLGTLVLVVGVYGVAMSFMSAHSEGVEENERARLIRERSVVSKCLYLEGKVPDGKGDVGRCRYYEFDMVDMPYCIYCRQYTPTKGEPRV